MSIYEEVNRIFNNMGVSVREVAKAFGYDEIDIAILDGNIDFVVWNAPDIYNNIVSCTHQADTRDDFAYARDLVACWVYESYFRFLLSRVGIKMDLAGSDKDRMILPASGVSNNSDYVWHLPGGDNRNVELVCDFGGYWGRNGVMHLRDNKYIHLAENASILMGIDCVNHRVYLIDFGRGKAEVPARYLEEHPRWHKPAYEIDLKDCKVVTCQSTVQSVKKALSLVA